MTDEAEAERLITDHLGWLQRRKRATPDTIRTRRGILRRAHRDLLAMQIAAGVPKPKGLRSASDQEINAWIYSPGWSDWTRKTYDTGLRSFFAWAVSHGKLTLDPMFDLAPPLTPDPEPQPITDEHLALLLGDVEPIPTIVLHSRYEGLRRAEIAGLYREDITEAETFVRRAKGGRRAKVPTHPVVWAHVQALPVGPAVQVDGQQLHPLLYGAHGQITREEITREFARARVRLGIPVDVVLHHGRHRFGDDVRRITRDPLAAMRALRQRSPGSLLHYTRAADDEVRSVVLGVGSVGLS